MSEYFSHPSAWKQVGAVLLVLAAADLVGRAAPPSIANISLIEGSPQLSIASDLGVTNQIQILTNLVQANWVLLTSLVVTQSPYAVIDTTSPTASQRFYRVVIPSSGAGAGPPHMVLIPAGSFAMGDTFNEGSYDELPVHTDYVSAVYLDQYEMTKGQWDQVMNWSLTNGYSYDYQGGGKGPSHPVESIDWYDAVKWCNARSEMEGRVPSYYSDAALTQVYRSGEVEPDVNWHAGYRLPTEAEWEKAARGGASGHRFPWTDADTISHRRANYYSSTSYSYDLGPEQGFDPPFEDGTTPYTAPVGSFAPNAYGLYDMAGNVWEWCWDYASTYSSNPQTDPRGPITGSTRVGRGGNWDYYPEHCRNAYRFGNPPTHVAQNIGFRCALSAP